MCGITGIFDTRTARPIERAVLHRMNESQHHRGPDGSGRSGIEDAGDAAHGFVQTP